MYVIMCINIIMCVCNNNIINVYVCINVCVMCVILMCMYVLM